MPLQNYQYRRDMVYNLYGALIYSYKSSYTDGFLNISDYYKDVHIRKGQIIYILNKMIVRCQARFVR